MEDLNLWSRFQKITSLVFDVDGVFTDQTLLITENGELLRRMNVRDGYAVKRALNTGINIFVITGGSSIGVEKRLRGLGIQTIYTQSHDKLPHLQEIVSKHNLSPEEILYTGDDLPDIPCLHYAGLACVPNDATPEALDAADFVSQKKGGYGCVRDIIEKVMRSQDKW